MVKMATPCSCQRCFAFGFCDLFWGHEDFGSSQSFTLLVAVLITLLFVFIDLMLCSIITC